ncbi:unnamed protein product [Nyctereutes procyonoides]|uniref:(raccoon dog) hypothetical protein n=1 Tax=Nyctereutes procyonoides TaxID=34880 RepID=A0A811ZW98_NYCPR|nr:unnamed protein product [Nyctereutes procyonoides]
MEFSDAMSFGVRTVVKVHPAPRPPTGHWRTPWSRRTEVCPSEEIREDMVWVGGWGSLHVEFTTGLWVRGGFLVSGLGSLPPRHPPNPRPHHCLTASPNLS